MTELVPALRALRLRIEDAVEGAEGTVVAACIEQGGVDVAGAVSTKRSLCRVARTACRSSDDKVRGGLGRGGHRRGFLPAIEPRPGEAEGVTGGLNADLRGQ